MVWNIKVRKVIGKTDKLKGGGLRSNHVFDQKKDMKEAITNEDKLNVEWTEMQIIRKSRGALNG